MSAPDNLNDKTMTELRALARIRGLRGYSKLRKRDLMKLLQNSRSANAPGDPKPSKRSQPRSDRKTHLLAPAPRPGPPALEPGSLAPNIDNAQNRPDPRADRTKFSPGPAAPGARRPVHRADNSDPITSRPALHAPRLVALPQKPGILHVYWRLPEDPVAELRLRIVRIDRGGDGIVSEIIPMTAEGNAYIQVPETADMVEYRAELGRNCGEGNFDLVVPSVVTRTPRNEPSIDGDTRWWISGEEFRSRFARADHAGSSSWTGPSSRTLINPAVAPQIRDEGAAPEEPAGDLARN